MIDPELDTIKVYRRMNERYDRDILTTPLLPGLELPLSRIFQER
jgi:hypothetical protein